jgi:hypothetical protein
MWTRQRVGPVAEKTGWPNRLDFPMPWAAVKEKRENMKKFASATWRQKIGPYGALG